MTSRRKIFAFRPARWWLGAENLFWERRLRIRTRVAYAPDESYDDGAEHFAYEPTTYRVIMAVLRRLELRQSDVFVVLGCGMGRVVCSAARRGVAQVLGVEDMAGLCDIARWNAQHMRSPHSPITIIHGRAEEFDFTQGTVFYWFNPFGPATLRRILDAMESGMRRNPRPLRIAYVNPLFGATLRATGWLERYDRWRSAHMVSLWRTRC
jgi:hypothetical protein